MLGESGGSDRDVLAMGQPDELGGISRRRWWVFAVVSALVLGAAGVGFAAGSLIGGGGTQPEDVLPDTVLVYADLDLDPPAGQKLNVVRLLGRFPDVEDEYGPEPDLRSVLVDRLTSSTDLDPAEVESWAGDRAGVGIAWDGDQLALTPVAAIAVTDEAAALSDLRTVVDDDQVAAADGYVVLTSGRFAGVDDLMPAESPGPKLTTQTAAEIVSAGEAAALGDSDGFTEAFGHLEDGVASAYVNGDGVAAAGDDVAAQLGLNDPGVLDSWTAVAEAGPSAAVVRAEPDAIELLGWTSSSALSGSRHVDLAQSLPDSTLLALELTGGATYVREQWDNAIATASSEISPKAIDRELADVEAQTGLRLPDDLETLFGDDLVLAVDSDGLLTGVPGVGARSITDPAAGADLASRLQKALDSLTGGFGVTARPTDDGLVVASSPEYADTLVAADGTLGDSAEFRDAVPDADKASHLMWLDFSAISAAVALAEPDAANLISPLQSFGVAVWADGDDGGVSVKARLVFTDDS